MKNRTMTESSEYRPESVELKWQKYWEEQELWKASPDAALKKYYVLVMFPYPSGRIHMGHVRNYTIGDVIARVRRAQGHQVLHPMGWDAFGLPAENAAIKKGVHPRKWTLENIQVMKKQLSRLGLAYDWSREITTCLPEYYKWEQLVFTKMFEEGLAYKKASTVNWCPSCQTVLANEQVEDGKCWRCESETTTRELEQWFLKTTKYAEELLEGLKTLKEWPERVRLMQENWIGRSEGAQIQFELEDAASSAISVFTTRPDTLFGVTYLALAPEHALVETLLKKQKDAAQVRKIQDFVETCRKQDQVTRTSEDSPKEGVFTGSYALHPITGDRIPIYVANFVLLQYGTGALMAVPAHDTRDHAFAKKYGLEIKEVIRANQEDAPSVQEAAYTDAGTLVQSGEFDGVPSPKAKSAIVQKLSELGKGQSEVQYRMRDWGLSRQRYWGSPIPIIYCDKCGTVPVPEKDLPVELPEKMAPLAENEDFIKTSCPKCQSKEARRETDTMDTFMESSWYYLRFLSPKSTESAFDADELRYWMGIDQYIGGIEHATMHLLYFRFFHRVLRDLKWLPQDVEKERLDEPAKRLLNQGIVYKDGAKMSKSKGNVVDPDYIVEKYGADTARLFSMFAAPPEKVLEWSDQGVEGSYRFLGRVWRLVEKYHSILKDAPAFSGKHSDLSNEANRKLRSKTHATIKKFHFDFENGYHFNTSIAATMELVNETYAYTLELGDEQSRGVLREALETVVRLLNPFVPHITETLWEKLGHAPSLLDQRLPEPDPDALTRDLFTYVIQVNGKLRGKIEIGAQVEKDKIIELAQKEEKVANYLSGKDLLKTIFVPKKLINFVVKK